MERARAAVSLTRERRASPPLARASVAALGFAVHTGRATCVAVSHDGGRVTVLVRRRIALLPQGDAIPRFVYHDAALLAHAAAAELVGKAEAAARACAEAAIAAICEELGAREVAIAACGVIVGATPLAPEPSLDAILRAHPLIHAAEGRLFQHAVAGAAAARGLRVVTMRERDAWTSAAHVLRREPDVARREIAALRATLGPPWTADEKNATAAALSASAR